MSNLDPVDVDDDEPERSVYLDATAPTVEVRDDSADLDELEETALRLFDEMLEKIDEHQDNSPSAGVN